MKNFRIKSNYKVWLIAAGIAIGVLAAFGVQRTGPGEPRQSPFSASRAFADLEALTGLGARPAGSPAIAKAREYIVAELKKAGLEPVLDEFEPMTPRGPRKMVNIRAVRPGAGSRIIALAGHYDTKLFDFSFVGANDGGSSAAWLLEMARATSGLKLENNLEFIFFDGEEAVLEWTDTDSVYGSRHDVDRRYRAGSLDQLEALILVDMIGDRNLNILRESASTTWLTDIVWNTAHSLGFTKEFVNSSQSIADDHVPFLKAGVPAMDVIDFDYPYWHTPADTLDKTSAMSLKIVGDVIYFSLSEIDRRVTQAR
jgi:glutaminyl-peptide cyclotransferase